MSVAFTRRFNASGAISNHGPRNTSFDWQKDAVEEPDDKWA